jgi:hypothetical protein
MGRKSWVRVYLVRVYKLRVYKLRVYKSDLIEQLESEPHIPGQRGTLLPREEYELPRDGD